MVVKALRFANLFVNGVNAGIAMSHALQAPQKAKLDRKSFLVAQQTLYLKYGVAASVLEPLALLSSVELGVASRKRRPDPLMLLAGACVVAEIAVWAKFLDPINRQVAEWDADHMPQDWSAVRDRWHALHRVRALLTATALGASAVTAIQNANDGQAWIGLRAA